MRRSCSCVVGVAALLLAAAGCSTGMTGGTDPCHGSSPPASCSQPCGTGAASCPSGYYCGTAGTCTSDCNATDGTGCSSGQVCSADGRCLGSMDSGTPPPITDAGAPDNTCAEVMLDGTHTTPNVILLVDRSGSMNTTFDRGLSRWDVLQGTLMQNPGGFVASLQHTVRFGLALFTGDRSGTCPDLITVLPPALDNYMPISTVYSAASPGYNTPTGESMNQLVSMLSSATLPPGPTIIILATDGEPNTCSSTHDTTAGQAMSVAAAGAAQAAGYTVDAIGVGTDVALTNLQAVAAAGGGTAYSVTDTASLTTALNTIIGGAVSCDITLSGMVDPLRRVQRRGRPQRNAARLRGP